MKRAFSNIQPEVISGLSKPRVLINGLATVEGLLSKDIEVFRNNQVGFGSTPVPLTEALNAGMFPARVCIQRGSKWSNSQSQKVLTRERRREDFVCNGEKSEHIADSNSRGSLQQMVKTK